MDRDRSMADRYHLSESEVQRILSCTSVFDPRPNIVISDSDDQTSNVGAQDETAQA